MKTALLLLILDNCEHVIAEVAVVADVLLRGCPSLRNPRDQSRIDQGRRRTRLPATVVEYPIAQGGCAVARSGCQDLWSDRALLRSRSRCRPCFTLTDDNAPAVAELCRRLDGIPLAIELASARVNSLAITTLTERLEDRFRLLASDERTALPRQQTMRATIDWSYDSLSEPEQRLFERLSVFAGGFMLATAARVGVRRGK